MSLLDIDELEEKIAELAKEIENLKRFRRMKRGGGITDHAQLSNVKIGTHDDVNITSPTEGQMLIFDADNKDWENLDPYVTVVDITKTCSYKSTFSASTSNVNVWVPTNSNKIRIKYISYSNRDSGTVKVALRFDSGEDMFPITLAGNGIFASNMVSGNLESTAGQTLNVYLDGTSNTVDVFVVGEEV